MRLPRHTGAALHPHQPLARIQQHQRLRDHNDESRSLAAWRVVRQDASRKLTTERQRQELLFQCYRDLTTAR